MTNGHSAEEDDAQEVDRQTQDDLEEAVDGREEGRGDAEAEVGGEVAGREESGGDAQAEGHIPQADHRKADDRAQTDQPETHDGGPQAEEASDSSQVPGQAHHREAEVGARGSSR